MDALKAVNLTAFNASSDDKFVTVNALSLMNALKAVSLTAFNASNDEKFVTVNA